MASGESSVGAKKGVKPGDSRKLMEIDRIIAWTFRNARDLPPGTISRSYVANFLKRSEDFVKRNWKINPYESLVEEKDEQRALSQESKIVIREMLARPKKKSVRAMMKDLEKTRKKKHSYGAVYNILRADISNRRNMSFY